MQLLVLRESGKGGVRLAALVTVKLLRFCGRGGRAGGVRRLALIVLAGEGGEVQRFGVVAGGGQGGLAVVGLGAEEGGK